MGDFHELERIEKMNDNYRIFVGRERFGLVEVETAPFSSHVSVPKYEFGFSIELLSKGNT